jgi:hypothetical protein
MSKIYKFLEHSNENKEMIEYQKRLIGELNNLMEEYRDYQKYFIGRTPAEAESRYELDKMEELGYDSESRFSLDYNTSLKKKMEENRKKRNDISLELRNLKYKLKSNSK